MTTTKKEQSTILVDVISKYLGTQIVSVFGAATYLSKKSIVRDTEVDQSAIKVIPMDLTTGEFTDEDLLSNDILFEVRINDNEQSPSRIGLSKFIVNFPFIPTDFHNAISFIYQYRIITRLVLKVTADNNMYQLGVMIRSLKNIARDLPDGMNPFVEKLLNQLNINYFVNANGTYVRTCNTETIPDFAHHAEGLTVADDTVIALSNESSLKPIAYKFYDKSTKDAESFIALLSPSGTVYHFNKLDIHNTVFVSSENISGTKYSLYTRERFESEFESISVISDSNISVEENVTNKIIDDGTRINLNER